MRLESIARRRVRSSIEVPGSGIETYLRMVKAVADQGEKRTRGGYSCAEDFVIKRGRPMNATVNPVACGGLRTRGECFRNAATLALSPRSRLIYCEGFAHTGLIPTLHAWVMTFDGRTIDPTWGLEGIEYYGVAIRRDYLSKIVNRSEFWGSLIDCWKLRWPMLDAHPRDWRHEIMDKLPSPEAEAWP